MEGFTNNSKHEMRKIEGSDSWLSGPEMEEVRIHESPVENLTEQLKPGVALDGGEQFEVPIPRNHLIKENAEEVIEEATPIPKHLELAAKTVLPIFMDSVSRGAAEGWDTTTKGPTKKFIEVEGSSLEKIVTESATGWREDCIVYDILRSEPTPERNDRENDREIAVKNALIKRASRYCPN
ncbi:MAG: hypothetical protein AAB497_04015 [Patescibacteria group bacterium]